jgi:hypothetical protein
MSTANKQHSTAELIKMIEAELEFIGEQNEECWREGVEDLGYLLDPSESDSSEFIRNFKFGIDIESFKIGRTKIEDTIDLLHELDKIGLKGDDVSALLFKYCTIEYNTDYHSIENTLNSMSIGEMEEQIDFEYYDELRELIEQLPEEVRIEQGWNDDHTTVYTRPCEFIAAVLDVESFLSEVKRLIRVFNRANSGPATLYKFSSKRAKQRPAEYNIALKRRELFRPNFDNVIHVAFGRDK